MRNLGAASYAAVPLSVNGVRGTLIVDSGAGRAWPELVVEDIRLVGSFSTEIENPCARCLEPVHNAVSEKFDLLYRPLGVDASGEEVSISQAETEIGYYQGEGLLLEDVLKEQVLLALPVKQVCRPNCKGLCPQCGKNLNVESCDCVASMPDPRWSALEDIRKKLER